MSVGTERNPESDDQFEMWRHSENQKNKPEKLTTRKQKCKCNTEI